MKGMIIFAYCDTALLMCYRLILDNYKKWA